MDGLFASIGHLEIKDFGTAYGVRLGTLTERFSNLVDANSSNGHNSRGGHIGHRQ